MKWKRLPFVRWFFPERPTPPSGVRARVMDPPPPVPWWHVEIEQWRADASKCHVVACFKDEDGRSWTARLRGVEFRLLAITQAIDEAFTAEYGSFPSGERDRMVRLATKRFNEIAARTEV